jgi:hypothetical protein
LVWTWDKTSEVLETSEVSRSQGRGQ